MTISMITLTFLLIWIWSLLQFKGYIYLNLSFYFIFASTFNPTGSYSSTESQNVNNHKSGKLQRTTTLLLSSSLLLLSSSRTATKLVADVVCLSYSPACLQLHQGLLLPRSILWPPLTTESLVDPPFMCVFSHLPIFYIWFFLLWSLPSHFSGSSGFVL